MIRGSPTLNALHSARRRKNLMVFNFSGFFGADFDCRARPGRFKDSVRHTQVLQPIARSDQRIGASTNDRDKMFDLRRERVGSLKRDCLGVKWFEPGAVFLPRVALEPHRWNRKRTVRSHHHIGVFIGVGRVGFVLLRRLFPRLGRGGRVGQ
jgi:hypothetical protein